MIKINKLFKQFQIAASIALILGFMTTLSYAGADVYTLKKVGPLKLAPNSVEIIDLDSDISSVILSNPSNAEVSVENSRKVILRPIAAGATSLLILSTEGQIIYKRDILIDDRHGKYIRVRRMCQGMDADDCAPNDTYYCPDGCYEVIKSAPATATAGSGAGNTATGGASAGNSGDTPSENVIIPNEADE